MSLHCVVGVKLARSVSVSSVRNAGRDEHGTSAQASMVLWSAVTSVTTSHGAVRFPLCGRREGVGWS